MGLCIDADENEYNITFEIRSKSIKFYDRFHSDAGGVEMIELTKEQLRNIVDLCNNIKWQNKIFHTTVKEQVKVQEDNTIKIYKAYFKANKSRHAEATYIFFAARNEKEVLHWIEYEELGNHCSTDYIEKKGLTVIRSLNDLVEEDHQQDPMPAYHAFSNNYPEDWDYLTIEDFLSQKLVLEG